MTTYEKPGVKMLENVRKLIENGQVDRAKTRLKFMISATEVHDFRNRKGPRNDMALQAMKKLQGAGLDGVTSEEIDGEINAVRAARRVLR